MKYKPSFKIVISANGFSHVRYSESESELMSFSDKICSVCQSLHISVKSALYRFDSSDSLYILVYTRKENF